MTLRHDDGLGALLEGSGWETVTEGVGFAEGPLWLPDGSLLFSDIPNSRIYSVRDGVRDVFREPSGQSNGLTLDRSLALIDCEHENRRLSREENGVVSAIATHYEGKRLNSPNDVVVRSDGRVFFTDPPYGIVEEQRELPFNGVFTLGLDGSLSLLSSDFDRPNGLAFSPDERTIYIADTPRHHVRAFDVGADGALSGGRVWAEMREPGRPDGIKVDSDGRVYACAGTLQVFDHGGRPLGLLDCPQSPANCAWGEDGSTLFVTARTAVYKRRFAVTGLMPSAIDDTASKG